MPTTLELIKELRSSTDAPYGDCVTAVKQSGGDLGQAKQLLREMGILKGEGLDRTTNEGRIFSNGEALLVLRCETDFAAKTPLFEELGAKALELYAQDESLDTYLREASGKLGETIRMGSGMKVNPDVQSAIYVYHNQQHAAVVEYKGSDAAAAYKIAVHCVAIKPKSLNRDSLSPQMVETELASERTLALAEGKPEAIAEKIAQGRLSARLKEFVLMEQPLFDDATTTVGKYAESKGIEVTQFVLMSV